MFHKFSGVAKAAASISLAGGILVMAALPAAAAASPNDAYAASSAGLIAISPADEAGSGRIANDRAAICIKTPPREKAMAY